MTFRKIDMEDKNNPDGRRSLMVYGFNKEEFNLIQKYNKSLEIDDVLIVDENQLDYIIDDLLKNMKKTISYKNENSNNDKTILFNAFSNKDIHDYINKFKEQIDLNPIFAVITPHSVKWTFRELIGELANERREMSHR